MKPAGSPKSNKGDVKFDKTGKKKQPNEEFKKKSNEAKTKITPEGLSVKALDSVGGLDLDDYLLQRLN